MNNFLFNYYAAKIKKNILGQKITHVGASLNTVVLNSDNGLSIFFKLDSPSALFFGDYTIEKTQNAFAVNLQKKLNKLKITDVDFRGIERVLILHLLDKRLDIENCYHLIFEITGRNGNLILTDSNQKIIEAYRLINARQILPNRIYKKPHKMLDITIDDIDVIKKALNKDNILGIDSFTKKFVTQENIESFINVVRKPYKTLFKYTLGEKSFVYPFLFDFGLDVSSINEKDLFNKIFTQNTQICSNNAKIINLIDKKIHKLNDKIKKIQIDIQKAKDAAKWKLYADTLLANINSIELYNDLVYLTPPGSESKIPIPINTKKTIQDNINTYYKLYKKYKNAKNILESVLNQTKQEHVYLLQIKEQLLNHQIDPKDVKLLFNTKTNQRVISTDTISYEHFKILDFDVYLGKNAKGNDLILKNASKEDIWMHPKSIPGPHLILKNPKRLQQIDKNLLEQCAQKIRERLGTNDKIEVDYTFVKFVKKPKGFKKGRVIYSNFKTVMVG
jgi:predicted ribosome quality control (RQC) complex YloA/Tae2 family protein